MAGKRRRGIRPLAALLFALIFGVVVFLLGRMRVSSAEKQFVSYEADMPEVQIQSIMDNIKKGEYGNIFAETQKLSPTLDSEETYIARLTEILSTGDPENLSAEPVSLENDKRVYQLVNGDTLLGTLTLVNENGEWKPAFPIHGSGSYRVEVPQGVTLIANGTPIGQEHLIESGKEASNFFQITDSSIIPTVDIYEFEGLLGEPALNKDEGYAIIKDVLSGNWLMGKEITDEELKERMIYAAEQIAMYPAQDTPLSNVAAVSDTNAAWYRKYVSLQNYWFTAHDIMKLSNETCKAVAQSDDTIVAQIAFDYFADNGEVNRTWHCGYQLTFRKVGDEYLVCGTEISSLLNPAQPH